MTENVTEKVRQGRTGKGVRYVLVVSVGLAVIALAAVAVAMF
jgi:hypothetical protein